MIGKPLSLTKCLAFALASLLAGNPVLGALSESSVWADRRDRAVQLASLPTGLMEPLTPSFIPPPRSLPSRFHPLTLSAPIKTLAEALSQTPVRIESIQDNKTLTQPPVVILQDIHLNSEAQKNLAASLSSLIQQNKIGLVGVEGAFNPLDFSKFTQLPNSALTRRIAAEFLDQQLVAAPTFTGIMHPFADIPFVGVDDRPQHQANVNAYLESRKIKSAMEASLAEWGAILAKEKEKTFSPALNILDQKISAYHEGRIGLGEHLNHLSKTVQDSLDPVIVQFLDASAREASTDFSQVEQERKRVIEKLADRLTEVEMKKLLQFSLAFKTGAVGFGDYYTHLKSLCEGNGLSLSDTPAFDSFIQTALMADSIDASRLLHAAAELERQAWDTLIENDLQRTLAEETKALVLTKKLIDFSLTPAEWGEYKTVRGTEYGVRSPRKEINNFPFATHDARRTTHLKVFESFYSHADARSRKMVENLLAGNGERPRVLVAGGFHGPDIAALLLERGHPVITASPFVTKVDEKGGSAYLTVFAREKTPLDQLFEGEKLFVAPALVNSPLTADKIYWADILARHPGQVTAVGDLNGVPISVAKNPPDEATIIGDLDVQGEFSGKIITTQKKGPKPLNNLALRAATNAWVLPFFLLSILTNEARVFLPHLSPALLLSLYFLTRFAIPLYVMGHEGAHLWADGQLTGLPIFKKIQKISDGLNQKSLVRAFLQGSELRNPHIIPTRDDPLIGMAGPVFDLLVLTSGLALQVGGASLLGTALTGAGEAAILLSTILILAGAFGSLANSISELPEADGRLAEALWREDLNSFPGRNGLLRNLAIGALTRSPGIAGAVVLTFFYGEPGFQLVLLIWFLSLANALTRQSSQRISDSLGQKQTLRNMAIPGPNGDSSENKKEEEEPTFNVFDLLPEGSDDSQIVWFLHKFSNLYDEIGGAAAYQIHKEAAAQSPGYLGLMEEIANDTSDPGKYFLTGKTPNKKKILTLWLKAKLLGVRMDPDLNYLLPKRIGTAAITRKIGTGGFGIALEGWMPDGTKVFVKIPKAINQDNLAIDYIFASALLRVEADVLRSLNSREGESVEPHLIRMGFSAPNQRSFLITEYIEGKTLNEFHRKWSAPEFERILKAVQALHQKGVVHGDLKPGQFLVEAGKDGEIDKVRIVDLASALPLPLDIDPNDPENFPVGAFIHTKMYVDPARMDEAKLRVVALPTLASDIYSLGSFLKNKVPIKGAVEDEFAEALIRAANPDPDLRPSLEELLTTLNPHKEFKPEDDSGFDPSVEDISLEDSSSGDTVEIEYYGLKIVLAKPERLETMEKGFNMVFDADIMSDLDIFNLHQALWAHSLGYRKFITVFKSEKLPEIDVDPFYLFGDKNRINLQLFNIVLTEMHEAGILMGSESNPRFLTQIGDLSHLEFVSQGTFGNIHKGKTPKGSLIAVKTVKSGGFTKVSDYIFNTALLLREAKNLKRAGEMDPGGVTPRFFSLGFDEKQKRHYLEMEYIEGESLAKKIGRLRGKGLLKIVEAVERLHEKAGFIHGDLSPAQMIAVGDQHGKIDRVVLLDLATAASTDLETGIPSELPIAVLGDKVANQTYLAPERQEAFLENRRAPATRKAEVYSLGEILGDLAYDGVWTDDRFLAYNEVQERAVELNPENRPTVKEIRIALEKALNADGPSSSSHLGVNSILYLILKYGPLDRWFHKKMGNDYAKATQSIFLLISAILEGALLIWVSNTQTGSVAFLTAGVLIGLHLILEAFHTNPLLQLTQWRKVFSHIIILGAYPVLPFLFTLPSLYAFYGHLFYDLLVLFTIIQSEVQAKESQEPYKIVINDELKAFFSRMGLNEKQASKGKEQVLSRLILTNGRIQDLLSAQVDLFNETFWFFYPALIFSWALASPLNGIAFFPLGLVYLMGAGFIILMVKKNKLNDRYNGRLGSVFFYFDNLNPKEPSWAKLLGALSPRLSKAAQFIFLKFIPGLYSLTGDKFWKTLALLFAVWIPMAAVTGLPSVFYSFPVIFFLSFVHLAFSTGIAASVRKDKQDRVLGLAIHSNNRIYVKTGEDLTQLRRVLFHELFHVFLDPSYLKGNFSRSFGASYVDRIRLFELNAFQPYRKDDLSEKTLEILKTTPVEEWHRSLFDQAQAYAPPGRLNFLTSEPKFSYLFGEMLAVAVMAILIKSPPASENPFKKAYEIGQLFSKGLPLHSAFEKVGLDLTQVEKIGRGEGLLEPDLASRALEKGHPQNVESRAIGETEGKWDAEIDKAAMFAFHWRNGDFKESLKLLEIDPLGLDRHIREDFIEPDWFIRINTDKKFQKGVKARFDALQETNINPKKDLIFVLDFKVKKSTKDLLLHAAASFGPNRKVTYYVPKGKESKHLPVKTFKGKEFNVPNPANSIVIHSKSIAIQSGEAPSILWEDMLPVIKFLSVETNRALYRLILSAA